MVDQWPKVVLIWHSTVFTFRQMGTVNYNCIINNSINSLLIAHTLLSEFGQCFEMYQTLWLLLYHISHKWVQSFVKKICWGEVINFKGKYNVQDYCTVLVSKQFQAWMSTLPPHSLNAILGTMWVCYCNLLLVWIKFTTWWSNSLKYCFVQMFLLDALVNYFKYWYVIQVNVW